ncbi:tetratricopeptide repeat protein [Vibrio scophthalmi]|uniref:tetratricopeptide repeat protein n=1 Tax=Vibrio scophthalmi TaxID=45658 RepID=UPI003EBD7CA3
MHNYIKQTLLVILFFSLQGCMATGKSANTASASMNIQTQEKLLEAANNNARLIEFYKLQLKANESEKYRLKLAQAYLREFDAESALFTIKPLLVQSKFSVSSAVVAAKAYIDLSQHEQARSQLEQAIKSAPKDGEVANLLGIVYAEQGDVLKARKMFELARSNFYDDTKIKNNLALLDMMEGERTQALQRIVSLASEPNLDKQLQANLMLIMAKNSQREYVLDGLDSTLSEVQKDKIYRALRDSSFQIRHNENHAIVEPVSESIPKLLPELITQPIPDKVVVPSAKQTIALESLVTELPTTQDTNSQNLIASMHEVEEASTPESTQLENHVAETEMIDPNEIETDQVVLIAPESAALETENLQTVESESASASDSAAEFDERVKVMTSDPLVIAQEVERLPLTSKIEGLRPIEPASGEMTAEDSMASDEMTVDSDSVTPTVVTPNIVEQTADQPEV